LSLSLLSFCCCLSFAFLAFVSLSSSLSLSFPTLFSPCTTLFRLKTDLCTLHLPYALPPSLPTLLPLSVLLPYFPSTGILMYVFLQHSTLAITWIVITWITSISLSLTCYHAQLRMFWRYIYLDPHLNLTLGPGPTLTHTLTVFQTQSLTLKLP
jgi:hypothetical protein